MKKIITLFLLWTLFLTSCQQEEEQIVKKHFETTLSKTGSLEVMKNYIGNVDSYWKSLLSPEISGSISFLWVKQWDMVYAWQLLAVIETEEIGVELKNNEKLISSLENIKTLTIENFEKNKEILKTKESQLSLAKSGNDKDLESTNTINTSELKTLESQIALAENRVELAEINLEKSRKTLDEQEKNIYSNIKNTLTNSLIITTNTINFVDQILGYTDNNEDKNDQIDVYIGGKDRSTKKEVERDFIEIYKSFLDYDNLYEENISSWNYDNETLKSFTQEWIKFSEDLLSFLEDFYDVIDNSIDNVYLPQTQIDAYKQQISSFGAQIEASLISQEGNMTVWLKGIMQSLENFYVEKDKSIALLEWNIKIEKSNLEQMRNTYTQYENVNKLKVEKIETQTAISEEQIKEIEKSIESLDKEKEAKLSELDLEIEKLKGGINSLSVSAWNALITAPFDGVINKKFIDIGTSVFPWSPLFEIVDTNNLFINAEISLEESQKLNIGETLTYTSETTSKTMTGTLVKIYPIANETTKNVKVEILPKVNSLQYWEIIKISFIEDTGEKEEGIIIANNAILEKFMTPWVYVLKENVVSFKHIEILAQNDYFSLVSGIESGETLLTNGKENFYDGEIIP